MCISDVETGVDWFLKFGCQVQLGNPGLMRRRDLNPGPPKGYSLWPSNNVLTNSALPCPRRGSRSPTMLPTFRRATCFFFAGQLPLGDDGQLAYVGKLGKEISVEEGYAAARLCALYCIAQVKAAVSSLDKVKRVLRVGGFVNCTDDFIQMPQVLNGASDLIVEVFGDKGPHTRAVVGSNSLHGGVAVEVEMMVAVAVA